MIPRYTPKDFEQLWSPTRKFQAWFDVEIAACRAMEQAGVVPLGTAEIILPARARLDADRIDAIEQTTRHDVIAFLTHVEELAGLPARWLHRGMTSSDVLDTSLALLLVEAVDKIEGRLKTVLYVLRARIEEHKRTPMMGRSHGMFAEPVALGVVLAGHYAEFSRALLRIQDARKEIAVGKIAGAVGTYAHLTPEIEANALATLGLRPETVATQIVPRDRHAYLFQALALLASCIERLATNVRHWQRTEVSEAREAFSQGQKGSSAMPHKRNPIVSENLCGLARVVRAAVVPALENVVLWHERDISHSSVERMLCPDVTTNVAYMLDRTRALVQDLVIDEKQMRAHVESARGLWASEGVLLALVDKGVSRQEGYVWVQRNAMSALNESKSFMDLLINDADIGKQLTATEIQAQFDLNRALRFTDALVQRAFLE